MISKKNDRISLYTLIIILSLSLTVGTIIFTGCSKDDDPGDGGGTTSSVDITDPDDVTGGTDAPDETSPDTTPDTDDTVGEPSESESDAPSAEETEAQEPSETKNESENVSSTVEITTYDEPRTMYALYNANARQDCTTDSIILFMIYQSEPVTVTGETDNGWYVVSSRGAVAYIRTDLLTDDASASEVNITEYTAPKTMYATSDVNVREGHSTNSTILGTISAGTEVTVTGETDNGWYQVSYEDKTAFIKSEYLSNKKPAVETKPAEETNDREAG